MNVKHVCDPHGFYAVQTIHIYTLEQTSMHVTRALARPLSHYIIYVVYEA